MKKLAFLIPLLLLLGAADPTTRESALVQRILIISIDGLRPDLLLQADTPVLHAILPQSTYTLWARTIPHAITLPAHTSMLTGVVPRKHEVEWNKDLPLSKPVYPLFPTIFEVAHDAGYTTAMACGKSKFSVLAKPGTLDWTYLPDTEKGEDAEVASRAVQIIHDHQPQVMFVHLPSVDNVGHKSGWSSKEQLAAIHRADTAVGEVLAALDDVKVRQSTVIFITSDHGGAGLTHLAGDIRAELIPWIVTGPGIRKDLDLTIYPQTTVDTEDTFATAAYLLGIPRNPQLDGKPVKEIRDNSGELLQSEAR